MTHDFDDSRAEALAEKFLEVKNTFVIKKILNVYGKG